MAPLDREAKEKLEKSMQQGKLGEVIEAYEKCPETRKYRSRGSGNTALHVAVCYAAVSYKKEDIVKRMVSVAESDVLVMKNKNGYTPFHQAVSRGNAYVCKLFAEKDICSMGARNDNGETPLFSAVSRGMTKIFLYLHYFCKERGCLEYGRYTRNNGDTILHHAISQELFDLAYIIIGEYPELVHQTNKFGISPLHILATKPSAFPSGVHHISFIHKLIYHCIRVQKFAEMSNFFNAPNPQPLPSLKKVLGQMRQFKQQFKFKLVKTEDKATRPQGNGEIDQRDEEAANEQVDHKENLQQDETTTNIQDYKNLGWVWLLVLVFVLLVPVYYVFRLLTSFPLKLVDYARVKRTKERSIWSVEVMHKLIPTYFEPPCEQEGQPPNEEGKQVCAPEGTNGENKQEKPIFIAAKNGISEIVSCILDDNPEAIDDVNGENKHIGMLAVEYRHVWVYELYKKYCYSERNQLGVDTGGNSLLHIAANFEAEKINWRIRGAALRMHMEIKWYTLIKKSLPPELFVYRNERGQIPTEIFQESHRSLIEEGRQWLTSTSQSCSVVAALIATVAFATSSTVPGGLKQDNGVPTLEHKPFFIVSATLSLIALTSSMISVVMFLGILTSNFKQEDFRKDLPRKLLLGLIFLLISIVSMFISFFAGHYFVLKPELKQYATLVYTLVCVLSLVFIIAKFPLDFEVVWTMLPKKPRR